MSFMVKNKTYYIGSKTSLCIIRPIFIVRTHWTPCKISTPHLTLIYLTNMTRNEKFNATIESRLKEWFRFVLFPLYFSLPVTLLFDTKFVLFVKFAKNWLIFRQSLLGLTHNSGTPSTLKSLNRYQPTFFPFNISTLSSGKVITFDKFI